MAKIGSEQSAYELRPIYTPQDLKDLVADIGFLPFFSSEIQGFSIDEATPYEVWEEYLGLGPWLWRDEIAAEKKCIYGKFFAKKTGYISVDWFPHFANYRRDGYDFDARYDDGLIRYEDKRLFDYILSHGAVTAKEMKRELGVDSKKAYSFEASLARLQMMTYVVPVDFVFARDKDGNKKYSYGTTIYDLPERWLGEEICRGEYDTAPSESFEKCVGQLMSALPDLDRGRAVRLLK